MFWFALLMVVLVPGMLAFVFGWLAFRSRVTGVYLSIITQAMTFALMLAFFRNEMGFGGNNGLTDFKDVLGFDLQADATRVGLFVLSALALAWRISSVAPSSIQVGPGGGGDPRRRRPRAFHRLSVEHYKLWLFVFSAMLAGIAGALYVPQVGIINPGEFSPLNSIELVIWVAVGGRGTLYGAVAGALLVNYAKTYFTAALPEVWLFARQPVRAGHGSAAARRDWSVAARSCGGSGMNPFDRVQIRPPGALEKVAQSPCRIRSASQCRARYDLYVEDVSVSFDGFTAEQLNLYIDDGELRCIIGANGAGKTTMMDVITGKTRPDAARYFSVSPSTCCN